MGQEQGTDGVHHGCRMERRREAVFEHGKEHETGAPTEVSTAASGAGLSAAGLSCCSGYEGIEVVALEHAGLGWHSRKQT